MGNCLEVLVNSSTDNEKLPRAIRELVNGQCMRNCLELLKNLSMGTAWEFARGIRKFDNNYCMINCLEVLENLSMGTAWKIA